VTSFSLATSSIQFDSKEVHVGFMVDKAALRQVYKYLGFTLSIDLSLRQLSILIHLIMRKVGETVSPLKTSVPHIICPWWGVTLLVCRFVIVLIF
jgi:hypothetical protein